MRRIAGWVALALVLLGLAVALYRWLSPKPVVPAQASSPGAEAPQGPGQTLQSQGEAHLLEYLSAPPARRAAFRPSLERAEAALQRAVAEFPKRRYPIQDILYLTFITEERGSGDYPKSRLDRCQHVCYGFEFENPDQSPAEFIRKRQQRRADPKGWSAQIDAQVGGGPGGSPFSDCRIPSNEAFLDLLGPLEGKSVIELGGGLGMLAWQIARRVGPSGRVAIVELDPGLGDFVKYTAKLKGYRELAPRVRFQVARSQYDPGVRDVDLVTMQDVHLMCGPTLEGFRTRTLPNLKRALRPGGRLAVVETFRQDTSLEEASRCLSEGGLRILLARPCNEGHGYILIAQR